MKMIKTLTAAAMIAALSTSAFANFATPTTGDEGTSRIDNLKWEAKITTQTTTGPFIVLDINLDPIDAGTVFDLGTVEQDLTFLQNHGSEAVLKARFYDDVGSDPEAYDNADTLIEPATVTWTLNAVRYEVIQGGMVVNVDDDSDVEVFIDGGAAVAVDADAASTNADIKITLENQVAATNPTNLENVSAAQVVLSVTATGTAL